jgi:thiopeptide-type bacteriocin biosynthesis protein
VIHHLQTTLQHAIQSHFVWKVQTDTYCRELERYGAEDITAIEQLFYADSTYVLQLLQQHTNEAQAPSLLFSALQYADDLLTLFHFTLPQKLAFVTHYQDAFEREFNPGKEEKEIYNQYYRQHTAEIQLLLQNAQPNPAWAHLLPPLLEKRNSAALQQLAGDLLHMHINRLFHMAQRRYEMNIYSVLYKHYRSMAARQGAI